ncbi:hypothetical protein BGLA2_300059 [Burkholderia gladioli]|nr:hypothetical protein BGLA2_300059 [Burkholderia gladioli]
MGVPRLSPCHLIGYYPKLAGHVICILRSLKNLSEQSTFPRIIRTHYSYYFIGPKIYCCSIFEGNALNAASGNLANIHAFPRNTDEIYTAKTC